MLGTILMRPLLLCSVVAWSLACTPGAAQRASPPAPADVLVGNQANGTAVTLQAGQKLTVELRSLGDGGYTNWAITTPPSPGVLALTASTHEPPSAAQPGNFGKDLFVFEARAPGETPFVATATRPWSGESATFTLDVTVR
jgi:predicted secreted protein